MYKRIFIFILGKHQSVKYLKIELEWKRHIVSIYLIFIILNNK